MEEGFVPDLGHVTIYRQEWVQGEPEKSYWHNITLKNTNRRIIQAFRCIGCGYLEFYAKQPAKKRYGFVQ
jgi:hypothetical protein